MASRNQIHICRDIRVTCGRKFLMKPTRSELYKDVIGGDAHAQCSRHLTTKKINTFVSKNIWKTYK